MKTKKHFLWLFFTLAVLTACLLLLEFSTFADRESNIYVGDAVTVTERTDFVFTPDQSGTYRFYSVGQMGNPCANLYDANSNLLASDDDSGDDCNFSITCDLKAGQTYYIVAYFSDGDSGSYSLSLERVYDGINWSLQNGVLTVHAESSLPDFDRDSDTPWYPRREEITSVVIENGITRIGDYAFANCRSLRSVTVPASVTSIGRDAFSICTSLSELTLPENITSIGMFAFEGCAFSSVTIPASVTVLDASAFTECLSLTEILVEEGNTVYSSLNGILYTADGTELLTCPIGKTGSVTVSAGTERIADSAFSGCGSITGVTIPSSVTYIGSRAFSGCRALTNMTIPKGVSYIGEETFSYCEALTGISVEAGNSFYSSADGILYSANGAELILCPAGKSGSVAIPEGVTSIRDYAFSACRSLTGVTIPDSVTSIGNNAFSSCYSLTNVNIPAGVTVIGWGAFNGCNSRTHIYCEVAAKPFRWSDNWCGNATVHWGSGGESDAPVILPGDVFQVDKETEYQFKPTVSGIYRFYSSSNLGDPCGYLYDADHNLLAENDDDEGRNFSIKYRLEAGRTYFLTASFYGGGSGFCLVNLEQIEEVRWTLAGGVLTIHAGAEMDDYDGWEYMAPWYAYAGNIRSVVLESGVTRIGEYAFANCFALTDIMIPASVTDISTINAFGGCFCLTNITVETGSTAYSSADGILYTADQTVLLYCPAGKIGSVTVPAATEAVDGNAFADCGGITSFTVEEAGALTAVDGILYSEDQKKLVCCPPGKTGSVTIPEGVAVIGESAFRSCFGVTDISIPASVTVLEMRAFYFCNSLTGITLPANLQSIGRSAFSNCSSLENVTIPAGVTEIGWGAFFNCTSLTDIYCEADTQPAGWDADWIRLCDPTVHWGYKPTSVPGDVSGDGILSIQDVTVLLQAISLPIPGNGNTALYDVSGDNIISIQDVTKLLQMLASAA